MGVPLKNWFNHIETWPIIAVAGGAAGLCSFFMYRTITKNPDISVDKLRRATAIRQNYDEGEQFIKGNLVRIHVQGQAHGIFPDLNEAMSRPSSKATKKE